MSYQSGVKDTMTSLVDALKETYSINSNREIAKRIGTQEQQLTNIKNGHDTC